LAGCAGAGPTSGTRPAGSLSAASPSLTVQATPGAQVASGAVPPAAGTVGPSSSDLSAMKAQLEAMQKEIDSLSLPTDDDFSDAESAVY
jgi:hypothetical protein